MTGPLMSRAVASLCVLSALLISPAPGEAFVCSTTSKTVKCLRWLSSNCAYLRVNANGAKDVGDGSDIAAVKRSAENWHGVTASCSYFRFLFLDESPDVRAYFDRDGGYNYNAIVWETTWPSEYDKNAAAITTVMYIERQQGDPMDGQLLDADIELNDQSFRFGTGGEKDRTDVENTVTHEMGHFAGLDHPCDDGQRIPTPKDHTGAVIPSCVPQYRLPQTMRDSTMFNFADMGETKKRTPEADDVLGMCALYPKAEDPGICAPPKMPEQGCSLARGAGLPVGLPALLLLLVLAAAALRKR
jgi:hypothetical protein